MIDITPFCLYDPLLSTVELNRFPYTTQGWDPPLNAINEAWISTNGVTATFAIYDTDLQNYTPCCLTGYDDVYRPVLNSGGVLHQIGDGMYPPWVNANLELYDTESNIAAAAGREITGFQLELTNLLDGWNDGSQSEQPTLEVTADGNTVSWWLPSELGIEETGGTTDGADTGVLVTIYNNDVYKRTWTVYFAEPVTDVTAIVVKNIAILFSIKAITSEAEPLFWTNLYRVQETGGTAGVSPGVTCTDAYPPPDNRSGGGEE